MNEFYIVLDETTKHYVCLTSDMIYSVETARDYYEHTKHEVNIYRSVLVGSFKEEELIV